MKIIQKLFLSFTIVLILNLIGCSDQDNEAVTPSTGNGDIAQLEKHRNERTSSTSANRIASVGCDGYLSGSWPSGSHTYPDETITLPCATAGGTISIACNAFDVPNKFSVYSNGVLIATTGWFGYSNNPGPWGNYPLNGPSVKTLSFSKGAVTNYQLRVETSGGSIQDGWDATITCSGICPTGPTEPPCPNSCGTTETGGYSGPSSYYTYPDRTLTFCPAQNGANIAIQCNAFDVPNKVSVYDNNGTLVVTSGWFGYSANPGPWGPYSLNGPSVKTISFVKSSSFNTYKLRVETALTVGTLPDGWETKTICP